MKRGAVRGTWGVAYGKLREAGEGPEDGPLLLALGPEAGREGERREIWKMWKSHPETGRIGTGLVSLQVFPRFKS